MPQVEPVSLRILLLHRNDVAVDHQGHTQQDTGRITGDEESSDGDAAGYRSVDNHVVAGRDQNSLHRRGHGHVCGKVIIVSLIYHHGDQDGAQ